MNGGKVYNSLNYKLNNDVIKIIQRYTLPNKSKLNMFLTIKYYTFKKCKTCNENLMKFNDSFGNLMYTCFQCWCQIDINNKIN
jgi:hypothetical protein